MRYGVIVADPPWQYANAGCRGAAENHYRTMTLAEICALPVGDVTAENCVLFLWATWPQLLEAQRVIAAWGFEYVTGFPWLKIVGLPSIDLWGDLRVKPQYGVGFWVRGCTEPLLIARRGTVSPPTGGFVGLLSENLRHSRKPDNVYHIAEQLPGPYLEMFCRRPRAGWDVWGNEVASIALEQPACGLAGAGPRDPPAITSGKKKNDEEDTRVEDSQYFDCSSYRINGLR